MTDMEGGDTDGAFDEWLRLWGMETEGTKNGFTQLVDGQEGLRHAVPIVVSDDAFARYQPRYQPVVLKARHYFAVEEETGTTSIALSRLVCLKPETFDEYEERVKSHE